MLRKLCAALLASVSIAAAPATAAAHGPPPFVTLPDTAHAHQSPSQESGTLIIAAE